MKKQIRAVLLDIEGTTSSLSFVHDRMFPYVREHLANYLREAWEVSAFQETKQKLAADAGFTTVDQWLGQQTSDMQQETVVRKVLSWMDQDRKATGLKQLQGEIWQAGFHSGHLVAHVWPDVPPALAQWRAGQIDLRIYSSGSIAAQKLFFGHTQAGNLLPLFSGHYDTTIGGKKSVDSYREIAKDWGLLGNEILFISDVVDELRAAAEMNFHVLLSLRPGNPPQPADFPCLQISDFNALTPWLM